MKTTCWLICGTMLGTSILAQDNTNSLPPMPPPLTAPEAAPAPAAPQAVPAPAAPKKARAAKKKKAAPRHRLFEPTVSLTPGPAEVKAKSLIVRGQPGFKGESITHLSQGETVNVLDEITLKHHVVGEPRQWAKIALPSSAHVWVDSKFIGPDGAVKPKKLNLRAGPGENYGVVGTLEQGATVNQIRTKGHWMEVAPPPNAFAFVAAMYLKPAPEAAVAPQPAPPPSEVMPQPAPVPEQPVMPAPETAPGLELTPERIATHEGVVRHTVSPITPTAYELYSLQTDQNIDYLYSTTPNLDLGRYIGMRIIVTGPEALADRFHNVPVLTVQRIIVVDTNAAPRKIYYSPRQRQEHR